MLFGVLDATPSAHVATDVAVARDLDVLLVERASTLRAHPGQIAFPGGRIDADDAGPVGAALREAREETGLDPAGVEVLGSLGDGWDARAAYNLERMTAHGARRAAEMEEAAKTLAALGVEPVMTRGTVIRQRAMAANPMEQAA